MRNKSKYLDNASIRIKNKKWLKYSSNIARRILSAIEDIEGMNQVSLAEKLNVSPQYVSKIVSGRENLSLETIAKFSDALEVELISFPPYKDSNESEFKRPIQRVVMIRSEEAINLDAYDYDLMVSIFSKVNRPVPESLIPNNKVQVDDNKKIDDKVSSIFEKYEYT